MGNSLSHSKIVFSIEEVEKILYQMKYSICKISKDNKGLEYGFFIKITLFNKEYKFLIINDNIHNKNIIKYNNNITLSYGINNSIDLMLDRSRRILNLKKLKIIMIEIDQTKDKIEEGQFIELDDRIININSKPEIVNKTSKFDYFIYLLNYDKNKKSIGYGKINNNIIYNIENINLEMNKNYYCYPILLFESKKIIGFNYKCLEDIEYKEEKSIYFPFNELKEEIFNEITIEYKSINNYPKIKLFGKEFVENNFNKCKIVYNNNEQELKEYLDIDNLENQNKIKIKLKGVKTITNMSYMFSECLSLSYLPDISNINTNNVTDMSYLFNMCISLSQLPDISKWKTTKLINMEGLLSNCSSLTSLPDISLWDTNNVKNMSYLFSGCSTLKSLPDISKWKTKSVINMNHMFSNCTNLLSLPDISCWDTINVKDISNMFSGCSSLINIPDISKWNLANIQNMKYLFLNCSSLFSLPDISKWNIKNINAEEIFYKEKKNIEDNSFINYNELNDLSHNDERLKIFDEKLELFSSISCSNTNIDTSTVLDKTQLTSERKDKSKIKTNIKSIVNSDNDLYNVSKSICKIITNNLIGTGFLIKLIKNNEPFYCLITCEHVINKEMIESSAEIEVSYNNQNDFINIKLNKKERFIRDYKYINIDATLIEIKEEEISKDYFLLKVVKDINKYRQLINDNNINIIQYPEGKNLNYSTGKIKSFNEYSNELVHLASTERGSSGSPIFIVKNSNKNVVIGIHKQGKIDKKENYGNFIYPIIKSLKNNYIYDIKKYGKDEYEREFKNNKKEVYGKYIYEDGSYYI